MLDWVPYWALAWPSKTLDLVPHECSSGAFWQTPDWLSCAFHCGVGSVWSLSYTGQSG